MQRSFIPAAVRFEDGVRRAHTAPAMPFRASPVTGAPVRNPNRVTADGPPASKSKCVSVLRGGSRQGIHRPRCGLRTMVTTSADVYDRITLGRKNRTVQGAGRSGQSAVAGGRGSGHSRTRPGQDEGRRGAGRG